MRYLSDVAARITPACCSCQCPVKGSGHGRVVRRGASSPVAYPCQPVYGYPPGVVYVGPATVAEPYTPPSPVDPVESASA